MGAPGYWVLSNVTASLPNLDFRGIKYGDVNNSWTPATGLAAGEAGWSLLDDPPAVAFHIGNAPAQTGESLHVPVSVGGFAQVTSADFTLQWDPTVLEFLGTANYGLPGLTAGSFGAAAAAAGRLTFAWFDPAAAGVTLADGSVLFTVELRYVGAARTQSPIRLADMPTPREVSVDFAVADFVSVDGWAWEGQGLLLTEFEADEAHFAFTIRGANDSLCQIETTKDLRDASGWKAYGTVALPNGIYRLVETRPQGIGQRFYRAVLLP